MYDEENNIELTVSGIDRDVLYALNAISKTLGKTRNEVILGLINKEFLNPITTYAKNSLLVKAMDKDLCERFGCTLMSADTINEHAIISDRFYKEILNLKTERDVDILFKKNISLIEFRANQVCSRRAYTHLPEGISLIFALFIEVAVSTPEVINNVWENIFKPTDVEGYFHSDLQEIEMKIASA